MTVLKVLLIEDNAGDARLIQEMLLEVDGSMFELESVDSLSTGLERLATGDIDVVLLDLGLPDSSGLDTFIKVHAQASEVAIVVLTGLDDAELAIKAVHEGAQDYLPKSQLDSELLVRSTRYAIERKRAEAEIRKLNEELELKVEERTKDLAKERDYTRHLMESSPDFLMTLDKDGMIMDVNRACEELFSKNREELIGTSIYEYLPEATMEKAIYQIFEKGKVRNIELKANIPEKGTIICNLSGTVFTTPEGESGIYITGRDITELKQAEEKLLRSERLAAIGELSASVAHELRQPLSVVNNAAYYLKLTLTEVDETTRDYFDMINEEVKSANDIISSLVALARAQEPDRKEVEIATLIEKAQGKITIPTNIRLRKDIPDDISAVFVDPVHIEQVFYNIINNGIQAMSMPEGGELAIIVRSKEKEANVAVSFVDTGVGISKENMDKIFEPLFTTKTRGIGLGLSICKNFVEANEGDITVQSEEGKGTTMTVVLPVTGLAG